MRDIVEIAGVHVGTDRNPRSGQAVGVERDDGGAVTVVLDADGQCRVSGHALLMFRASTALCEGRQFVDAIDAVSDQLPVLGEAASACHVQASDVAA